jgi:hypothetical protein
MMIWYHKLQGDVTVNSHFGKCLARKNPLSLESGGYDPHFLGVGVLEQPVFSTDVDDLVSKNSMWKLQAIVQSQLLGLSQRIVHLELDVDLGVYWLRNLVRRRIRLLDRLLADVGLMKINFSCIDCLVAFEPLSLKGLFQAVKLYEIF